LILPLALPSAIFDGLTHIGVVAFTAFFQPVQPAAKSIAIPSPLGWHTPAVPSPTSGRAWKSCADARTTRGNTRQFDLRKRVKGWSGQVRETPQAQRPRDCPGRESTTGIVRALVPRRERCNACRQFGVCVADAMWSSFRTRAQVCCWCHKFHLEQATPRTSLAVDYLQ